MPEDPKGRNSSSAANEISTGMVKLLADYTGRGPTKARTTVDRDLVAVLVEDTLTKGERSLVADGQSESVLRTRKDFQRAMRGDAENLVERVLGREVIAFMSENHIDPDIGIEAFVLKPE